MVEDGLLPPGGEVIHLAAPPPGEYVIGVVFYSDNDAGADGTAEITINCNGQATPFGPQVLANPSVPGGDPDIWQVARVLMPECEVTPVDQLGQGSECRPNVPCQCDDCAVGVCVEAGCPADACEPRTGMCGGEMPPPPP